MLMGPHDGAIDYRVFVVGVRAQALEQPGPDAALGPLTEPGMHRLPRAEPLRQVAPRDAGAVAEQHCLDEQPIVLHRHTDVALTAGQKILDPIPLVVAQAIASHPSVPRLPTRYESRSFTFGNPLIEDKP
jgi:hypothetical protein